MLPLALNLALARSPWMKFTPKATDNREGSSHYKKSCVGSRDAFFEEWPLMTHAEVQLASLDGSVHSNLALYGPSSTTRLSSNRRTFLHFLGEQVQGEQREDPSSCQKSLLMPRDDSWELPLWRNGMRFQLKPKRLHLSTCLKGSWPTMCQ